MTIDPAQLEALAAVCSGARPLGEAGIDYVFIPSLLVPTGATERTMDALLCPMQYGGYSTRLFLAEGTVKNYVSTILQKTNSRDRTQAVLKAHSLGLLNNPSS